MDYQRSKVYNWENYIENGKTIPFDQIQNFVNEVWNKCGLKYPPIVEKMPRNRTKAIADANRFKIRFHGDCCEKIILHEIAHSMTCDIDGRSHQHNEIYVAVHMGLLERFMNISLNMLQVSAIHCGVKFSNNTNPRIIDTYK